MTKEIQLTRGMVAIVDDDDFERANQFKWYATKGKKNNTFEYANGRYYEWGSRAIH